ERGDEDGSHDVGPAAPADVRQLPLPAARAVVPLAAARARCSVRVRRHRRHRIGWPAGAPRRWRSVTTAERSVPVRARVPRRVDGVGTLIAMTPPPNAGSTRPAAAVQISEVTEVTTDVVEAFARLIPQLSRSNPPPAEADLKAIV